MLPVSILAHWQHFQVSALAAACAQIAIQSAKSEFLYLPFVGKLSVVYICFQRWLGLSNHLTDLLEEKNQLFSVLQIALINHQPPLTREPGIIVGRPKWA